jgi:hypothetical protein
LTANWTLPHENLSQRSLAGWETSQDDRKQTSQSQYPQKVHKEDPARQIRGLNGSMDSGEESCVVPAEPKPSIVAPQDSAASSSSVSTTSTGSSSTSSSDSESSSSTASPSASRKNSDSSHAESRKAKPNSTQSHQVEGERSLCCSATSRCHAVVTLQGWTMKLKTCRLQSSCWSKIRTHLWKCLVNGSL